VPEEGMLGLEKPVACDKGSVRKGASDKLRLTPFHLCSRGLTGAKGNGNPAGSEGGHRTQVASMERPNTRRMNTTKKGGGAMRAAGKNAYGGGPIPFKGNARHEGGGEKRG